MANFCTKCGALLETNRNDRIVCDHCNAVYPLHQFYNHETLSRSRPSAFLSTLRLKKSVYQTARVPGDEAAEIEEPCPNCGNSTMRFTTLQLRSADEGSTVFYTCPRCL